MNTIGYFTKVTFSICYDLVKRGPNKMNEFKLKDLKDQKTIRQSSAKKNIRETERQKDRKTERQ